MYANTQNTHGAPGICTHSGVALLKLYRATGNLFYLQLLADIAHALPQHMSWKDRLWPGFHEAWISERSNLNDWLEGIGETFTYSPWAKISLMLSHAELPGVYVDLAREKVVAIDHVEARVLQANKQQLQVELSNPTRYDASVKVLAENGAQAVKPLLNNAALAWQQVMVPAGKQVVLRLNR